MRWQNLFWELEETPQKLVVRQALAAAHGPGMGEGVRGCWLPGSLHPEFHVFPTQGPGPEQIPMWGFSQNVHSGDAPRGESQGKAVEGSGPGNGINTDSCRFFLDVGT